MSEQEERPDLKIDRKELPLCPTSINILTVNRPDGHVMYSLDINMEGISAMVTERQLLLERAVQLIQALENGAHWPNDPMRQVGTEIMDAVAQLDKQKHHSTPS